MNKDTIFVTFDGKFYHTANDIDLGAKAYKVTKNDKESILYRDDMQDVWQKDNDTKKVTQWLAQFDAYDKSQDPAPSDKAELTFSAMYLKAALDNNRILGVADVKPLKVIYPEIVEIAYNAVKDEPHYVGTKAQTMKMLKLMKCIDDNGNPTEYAYKMGMVKQATHKQVIEAKHMIRAVNELISNTVESDIIDSFPDSYFIVDDDGSVKLTTAGSARLYTILSDSPKTPEKIRERAKKELAKIYE